MCAEHPAGDQSSVAKQALIRQIDETFVFMATDLIPKEEATQQIGARCLSSCFESEWL